MNVYYILLRQDTILRCESFLLTSDVIIDTIVSLGSGGISGIQITRTEEVYRLITICFVKRHKYRIFKNCFHVQFIV